MASTSTPSARPEREPANTCQEMAPSSSSVSPPSSRSFFSCCFDWVSAFLSRPSMEPNSMASTSKVGLIPENEIGGAVNETGSCTSPVISSRPMPSGSTTGCFQQIAPSASTSGASPPKPVYDVFINHRGPDVKKTLAASIYKILDEMKVKAFLDEEELEYGDFLPSTLETTIRGATLHIAIFSKSYVKSVWCLAELSCMLQSGAKIVPIFYHVDPNDVRYVAKGVYANDFESHVKKGRYSGEKLEEWKHALHKVSFYSGQIIKDTNDEVRLLKNIVNIVQKEMSNVPLVVARYPVGLTQAVDDFEKTLKLSQGEQRVQIIGIWGMGGLGKTTLAKELYNKRSYSMDKSSFIPDIREAKAKGMLHQKQNQLFKDLGVSQSADDEEHGKAILAKHLGSFRVLIVMDDVDHSDQLDALIPAKENLASGSLIIVTTREREVLASWGISSLYKMKALNAFDAKELFCWHAFLQSSPLDGFEGLVEKFVETCNGLPLSLKLFGGLLYGRTDKNFWESLFHKISRVLFKDIKERLKISYDALDDEEKEAFLDTACFFIGEKKSLAIEVWEGSGWSGMYTCERLVNKCLIEIDAEDYIKMHDHLRDLGREIASEQSPSRLWLSEQILSFTKNPEKTNGVRGVNAAPARSQDELAPYETGKFLLLAHYLVGLKFLVIRGYYPNDMISEVLGDLLWLRWSDMWCHNFPTQISLKHMRVLQVSRGDLEELWKVDSEAPTQLRELEVTLCKLKRLPNSIGCLNQMRKMVLTGCKNLKSLPDEFCHLQLLEHLELNDCVLLSSLPSSFGDLTNLQYLNLGLCRLLKSLPDSFKNLEQLQYLNLKKCEELILRWDDFQNITKLEFLNLSWCVQVNELPSHINNQVSLRELSLLHLDSLRELKIGHLSRLQKLEVGGESLISLPNSLGDSASLIKLDIKSCGNLESLPISFKNLPSLTQLTIKNCGKLKTFLPSVENLSSLTRLSIEHCHELESLPSSLGNLFSLTHLFIKHCYNLEYLPASIENLSSLTCLSIEFCKVKCLPFSVGCHNLLEHLWISDCPISQVSFEAAPLSSASSNLMEIILQTTEVCRVSISEHHYARLESVKLICNYQLTEIEALPVNLKKLKIWQCPKLEKLPSFERLTSLRQFEIEYCDRIGKIEGLEGCTRMAKLSVKTSWEVPGIESLKGLGNLKEVELRANKGSAIESCIGTIQNWPDEIIICAGTVPDACSVVDSFKPGLSPNLCVVDSFCSKDISSEPQLRCPNSTSSDIMLCYIINGIDSASELLFGRFVDLPVASLEIGEGRWALIAVFAKHSRWVANPSRLFEREGIRFILYSNLGKVEVERGLAVRGEKKMLVEAMLPLLQSI